MDLITVSQAEGGLVFSFFPKFTKVQNILREGGGGWSRKLWTFYTFWDNFNSDLSLLIRRELNDCGTYTDTNTGQKTLTGLLPFWAIFTDTW